MRSRLALCHLRFAPRDVTAFDHRNTQMPPPDNYAATVPGESRKAAKILVVNPNSSQKITQSLVDLFRASPPAAHITLSFFTGPPDSPKSIDDEEGCHSSASACLPLLLPGVQANQYDAYLVACYSEHPLPNLIRTASGRNVPTLGIFEASIIHALAKIRPDDKFGIITTGQVWETLLTNALHKFLGVSVTSRFAGVATTGYTAIELHDMPQELVYAKIGAGARKLVEERGARIICLGCAGMVGMEEAIWEGLGSEWKDKIQIIDGVQVGVSLLGTMV
jgi:Asp/Glu/hydantoin racemase